MTKSDPGLRAARRLMREHDAEPDHARQVTRNALALFEVTQALHGLGPKEKRLLEAGALLHDIGFAQGVVQHHKRARDMIMKAELPGFTKDEQRIVACLARYHRKAEPTPDHKLFADLSATDQEVTRNLAGILRIADGLDRSHATATRIIRFEKHGSRGLIYVLQRRPSHLDILGGMRKRGLFEAAFGVEVDILPEEHEAPKES